jgi:hypothetical protein
MTRHCAGWVVLALTWGALAELSGDRPPGHGREIGFIPFPALRREGLGGQRVDPFHRQDFSANFGLRMDLQIVRDGKVTNS